MRELKTQWITIKKPKDKDKVIGPGKPNEVSNKAYGSVELANRPRKPKRISKRAVDAQKGKKENKGT